MAMCPSSAIAAASAAVVALAVANRVVYKPALMPLKAYPFFLAQLTTFDVGIRTWRVRHRVLLDTLREVPRGGGDPRHAGTAQAPVRRHRLAGGSWSHFRHVGRRYVAWAAIPILSQSFLVWQLIFFALFLGRTYSMRQIIGCFLVTSGVILVVASGANESQLLSGVKLIWPALMVASSAFQAGASILKESAFIDGAKCLKGKRPDIFVANSFGYGFQALFVFLLLPVLSNLRGITFAELSAYLNGGTECFLNVGESPIGNPSCPEWSVSI